MDILQDALEISPRQSSVILCVNIKDPKIKMLTFGEENEHTSKTYTWEQVPKSTQDFLINYAGPKKYNLEIVK